MTVCFAVLISILLLSCDRTTHETKNVSPVVGTWEYTGNVAGMAVFNENDFIIFASFKPDSLFSDSLVSSEIVDRYNSMVTIAGTHVIQDSIVTCTTKYHNQPNRKGEIWRWQFAVNGDDLVWKVLSKDGKVRSTGTGKRFQN